MCYEVDARLRPSGNQGMLVSSLDAFERYHAESAQVWERQALLRARAVAGSEALAHTFEALRLQILSQPLPDVPGTCTVTGTVKASPAALRRGLFGRGLVRDLDGLHGVSVVLTHVEHSL